MREEALPPSCVIGDPAGGELARVAVVLELGFSTLPFLHA